MTGPFILITLGVLILLWNLYPLQFGFDRTWPVILIVIGVVKIVEHLGGRAPGERPGPDPRRDYRDRPRSSGMSDRITHDEGKRTGSDG